MTLECPSRLPPEIIGQIVSIVSADRNTLLACALVCQDWLSESRASLLRDIDISPETLNSFTSNILRSERVRPWLTSIHNLSLGYFYDNKEETFIPEISELMSNLRSMTWTNIFPSRASLRADLVPALGRFAHLRQLKLVHCGFPSFGDLTSFIVALPSLSSLTMWRVGCDDSADAESKSVLAPPWPEPRPTLSELSILAAAQAQEPNDLFHWLSSTPTRYALRDLSLDFCKIFAALEMVAAGTPLTALTVRMKGLSQVLGDGTPSRLATLAQLLSHVGDLEILRLHARFDRSYSWSDVARVLRLFTSVGSIRCLRVCYRSPPLDEKTLHRSLEHLDAILEENTFRFLKSVEFTLFAAEECGALRGKYDLVSGGLRRKLPKLHGRVAVDLCVYNSRCAFGPTGFIDDILHGPDFPHRNDLFY